MTRTDITTVLLFLLGVLFFVALPCSGTDLLLIRGSQPGHFEDDQIRNLDDFYGLGTQVVNVDSREGIVRAASLVKSTTIAAVIIRADAFYEVDKHQILTFLRERNRGVPVMVFGITGETDQNTLRRWSGGAVRSCASSGVPYHPKVMEVAQSAKLTRELGGVKLPAVASPVCKMQLGSASVAETLLAVRDEDSSAPVLVRAKLTPNECFFVAQETVFDVSWAGQSSGLTKAFSFMAPFVLFLSHAAGDYGWHMDAHYANLTIDDAWLIQPYGPLDYFGLLAEMEKHNFHTTIAFVPWNFDRNEPDVTAMFRSHRERFSVCVHGNNHAHREFGDYRQNPFPNQSADIRQAIARMERFSALTQLPYDRFMVFPHGVAPEPTFAALRSYGFIGTANSSNVPLGVHFPTDPTFLFRTYTSSYASFLSLSRYPVSGEIPRTDIAIQSFLGNPLLFYDHASVFESGITSFNAYADAVNHIEPDTKWTSLGEIARHVYLLRRRTDGDFDVRMLSSEMDLENAADTAAGFYVQPNVGTEDADTLTVDGRAMPYQGVQTKRLIIPPHESRRLRVGFNDDSDTSREGIERTSLYVYVLRMLSDFRDLHLSRSKWGRAFTKMYYQYEWDSVELYFERKWWVVLICIVAILVVIRSCSVKLKRRHATTPATEREHRT